MELNHPRDDLAAVLRVLSGLDDLCARASALAAEFDPHTHNPTTHVREALEIATYWCDCEDSAGVLSAPAATYLRPAVKAALRCLPGDSRLGLAGSFERVRRVIVEAIRASVESRSAWQGRLASFGCG